jgi:predicted nucleic acid-binding protein
MAGKIALVDTSLLIDFFRKTDKTNSKLMALFKGGYSFSISAVTEYEIYIGATSDQLLFWNDFLKQIEVLAFNASAVKSAVEINRLLKKKRKLIGTADLFIAATAMANNLPLATLNLTHFERIDGLRVIG